MGAPTEGQQHQPPQTTRRRIKSAPKVAIKKSTNMRKSVPLNGSRIQPPIKWKFIIALPLDLLIHDRGNRCGGKWKSNIHSPGNGMEIKNKVLFVDPSPLTRSVISVPIQSPIYRWA